MSGKTPAGGVAPASAGGHNALAMLGHRGGETRLHGSRCRFQAVGRTESSLTQPEADGTGILRGIGRVREQTPHAAVNRQGCGQAPLSRQQPARVGSGV
ncbi:MAG: hypothetical protein ACP5FH_12080 [Terracidiphilus sp.]